MGCAIMGEGVTVAALPHATVHAALFDPALLARAIPGCVEVRPLGKGRFTARIDFGVGPFRSGYAVELQVTISGEPASFNLTGASAGGLGHGRAEGWVRLIPRPGGRTAIEWRFRGDIGGRVSLAGSRLLTITARVFCVRFFQRLCAPGAARVTG